MATITIRNIDDTVKTQLRIRAASHNRSMEEEVRVILREALKAGNKENCLATLIHRRFIATGGVELPVVERKLRARIPGPF